MSKFATARREARKAFISAYPFELVDGGLGVSLTLNTTSGTTRVALEGTYDQALITNYESFPCFLRFGDSSVEATTACVCILPNIPYTLTLKEGATHVAGITASGSTKVQITLGHGN